MHSSAIRESSGFRRQLPFEGGLLQDSTQIKVKVLSVMHFIAEAWRFITPTKAKNCFMKCGFSNDDVCSNDGSAV
jgi:hypothetical protein